LEKSWEPVLQQLGSGQGELTQPQEELCPAVVVDQLPYCVHPPGQDEPLKRQNDPYIVPPATAQGWFALDAEQEAPLPPFKPRQAQLVDPPAAGNDGLLGLAVPALHNAPEKPPAE
jgi:hypothetical protein